MAFLFKPKSEEFILEVRILRSMVTQSVAKGVKLRTVESEGLTIMNFAGPELNPQSKLMILTGTVRY